MNKKAKLRLIFGVLCIVAFLVGGVMAWNTETSNPSFYPLIGLSAIFLVVGILLFKRIGKK